MCQGCEEEIPEAVSLEAAAAVETVLKQAREESRILAQRDHAIADIARRQDVKLAEQTAGTSSVVCDRDDGGDIYRLSRGIRVAGEMLEPLQKRREAIAAANRHHPERRGIFPYQPFFSG